jgi:O-antigen ligase
MTNAIAGGRAARFFMITLYLCVLSLWLAGYVQSRQRAKFVMSAYITSAAISALLGSIALFVSFPGSSLLTTSDGLRATGLFKDPNVFGPFLIPPAVLLIEEVVTPRLFTLHRLFKVALLLILVLGILFSYSRGAWLNFVIAVFVMLLVLAVRRGGAHKAIVLSVILLALGATATAAIYVAGSTSFLEERARSQVYDTERFRAQDTGFRLAERHPLGIGPGQFDVEVPVSSHSIYIRALAENGVLGFVCILALLMSTLLMGAENAVMGRHTYGIGSASLVGVWCGILANSAFVDTLHWRHLFVVAALIWAGTARRKRAFVLRDA